MINVQIVCEHQAHECKCNHRFDTSVDRDDLTSRLIKYNPNLAKYLGKKIIKTNEHITTQQPQPQQENRPKVYKSIVEQKGLNYLLPTSPRQKSLQKQQTFKQPQITKQQIDNNPNPQINSPKRQQKIVKSPTKKLPQQQQPQQIKKIKSLHKNLKLQSRYLSDTAFRKYFDRQCFENYGWNNRTHVADGFVYGNYLKTFNINPHTGENLPNNQQTFYHALLSASPQKYKNITEQPKGTNKPNSVQGNFFQKSKIDADKLRKDNIVHKSRQKKYHNIKMKSKNKINQPNIQVKQVPPHHNKQTSKLSNIQGRTQKINSPKNTNSQAQIRNQQSLNNISAIKCNHNQRQNRDCACCINHMKKLILSIADQDEDLANRIVASAKKTTLYKNYSLNNLENSPKNPHNYRKTDGKLNAYPEHN